MNPRVYFNNTDIYFDSEVDIYVNRFHENFDSFMHTHDFLEINYIAEGSGFHYINEEVLPVVSGDIFIIPVGTAHVYRPASTHSSSSLIVYNCVFPADQLLTWCQAIPHPFDGNRMFAQSAQDYYRYHDSQHEAKTVFEQLHKEFLQHRLGYRTLLIMRVIELLILLYRFENDSYAQELPPAAHRLDAVFTYVKKNYHLPLTLEQMAAMVYLSPSHFHRLFKKTTSQTFIEYVQNLRMEESCKLLRTTALTIQDIASNVGYSDMQFFLRLFKKKMGVTPRQYRNKR
ncbi:AraC family transcriptional regulator [Paenibacillus contaminans]|nr:AraC family transcriptional regulator [Paenibacillus contaminans]